MLLVIIGAGAAYDSSPDKPPPKARSEDSNRPPLANDLFADIGPMRTIRTVFPQLNQIIPYINPRKGRSIEESLQSLESEAGTNPRRPQELLAVRYYLQELFRVLTPSWLAEVNLVTNYQSLLGRIAHYKAKSTEPVLIVTFNYDMLIEHALTSEFGMKFAVMDDYICAPDFKLFKLHGSADWGRFLNMAPAGIRVRENRDPWAFREKMIEQAATLSITDTFTVIGTGTPFSPGPPLYPAIAIPVREKSVFECPASHLGMLDSLIPKVTKIITIGWRGAEQHFLKLMAQRLFGSSHGVGVVTVAATEDEAKDTLVQLQTASIPIHVGARGGACFASFSDSLAERRFDKLLSA